MYTFPNVRIVFQVRLLVQVLYIFPEDLKFLSVSPLVWLCTSLFSLCGCSSLLLLAQFLSLITRRINHVTPRCSDDLIPSQANQVDRTSFLAAYSDLHRRLMNKRQCDISRFLMGIVSIHLLCSGLVLKSPWE